MSDWDWADDLAYDLVGSCEKPMGCRVSFVEVAAALHKARADALQEAEKIARQTAFDAKMAADTIAILRAEIEQLREALHLNQRMAEMTAFLLRDKRRTKAYGAVADMVERIACQFDRMAAKTRTALTTQEKQNE
jgi:hypothetical protein